MSNNILRDFNAFVVGIGYAGKVTEYVPPILNAPGEEFRAAGMDAPISIDMGMDAMEATVTFGTYEKAVFSEWGKIAQDSQLEIRGALQNQDGSVSSIVHRLGGRFSGLEQPAWTPGTRSSPKLTAKLAFYECEIGGQVIHSIDVLNNVRIINGVDQLAALREAIGQ